MKSLTAFFVRDREHLLTSHDSGPDRVERVLLDEVGKAIGEVAGPVAEFTDQFVVQHELRTRIVARLRAEKIDIPVPTRTLHLQDRVDTGGES